MTDLDFCQLQKEANARGGVLGLRAYPQGSYGDRLAQYGLGMEGGDDNEIIPAGPGVYAISVAVLTVDDCRVRPCGHEHLMYIGCAKSLRKRLRQKGHWYERINDRFPSLEHAVILRWRETDHYQWMERCLIRNLRPLLNIQHKH